MKEIDCWNQNRSKVDENVAAKDNNVIETDGRVYFCVDEKYTI